MKHFILAALIGLSFSPISTLASDGHEHSGTYCLSENSKLCLHLGMPARLNTKDEGKFMVHFMVPAATAAKIEVTNVELWMDDMGHGSAPTSLQKMADGKYMVSNAWFIMTGLWSIRVKFNYDSQARMIVVPMQISE